MECLSDTINLITRCCKCDTHAVEIEKCPFLRQARIFFSFLPASPYYFVCLDPFICAIVLFRYTNKWLRQCLRLVLLDWRGMSAGSRFTGFCPWISRFWYISPVHPVYHVLCCNRIYDGFHLSNNPNICLLMRYTGWALCAFLSFYDTSVGSSCFRISMLIIGQSLDSSGEVRIWWRA